MRVVSFYSYKGGTGRTLLLANVAVLGARLGLRIVAVDLDIEAPGLSYKLLGTAPEGDGLTGWLRDLSRPAADHGVAWRLIPVDIDTPFTEGGWLRLLPAGAPPSIGYLQLLRELHEEHAFDEGPAVDALITLRDTIAKELQPDLLLIDARTGVTPTNSVINRVLSDDIVALTLASPEQLEGTRAVLRSLAPLTQPDSAEPLGLHVVLSRVRGRSADIGSYELDDGERAGAARVAEFLRAPTTPLAATLVVEHVHLLHEDATVRAEETLLMRRSDAIGSTALHVDYLRIAREVLGPIVDRVFESAFREASQDESLRVARFFARPDAILASRAQTATGPLVRSSGTEDGPDLLERIATLRQLAERDPTRHPDLGSLLVETSARQAELGDRAGALVTITEAVGLYRQLAEVDPAAFLPYLAMSLNNLSNRQAEGGDRPGALASITEAGGLYRQLAEVDPAAFMPELATSLNNLALQQAEIGDRAGALTIFTEAGGLYRQLAEADPAAFLADLAMSLNNLALQQAEIGDRDGALASITEAGGLYRQLAEADPAAFLPALATSLNNLAVQQAGVEDRDGALASIIDAVRIRRELAEADPAEFVPGLATSLNNLANLQAEIGDRDGALASIIESVGLYRQLVEAIPAVFTPDLAGSLNNLSNRQAEIGDRDGALASITEAVNLYRQLVETIPAAFTPDLAMSLNNLALRQIEIGDRDGALASITEAVSHYRQLVEQYPVRFMPNLAQVLRVRAFIYEKSNDAAAARADLAEVSKLLKAALTPESDEL